MKREEVLERLKKWIPSFQREYTGYPNGEWDSELEKYPKLKQVSNIMETRLFRILPQKEIDENPLDWESYEAGVATERFLDATEMFATAAFVTLYRFEGPLALLNSDFCIAYNKKDLILSVDSQDNVQIYSKALRMLVED